MKLISIKLFNFRQFYGQTPEIFLAWGEKRKITVIHGNNGAGKTGLLNAFTWTLYEKFTDAFASPEQLINKRALFEAKVLETVECWVEIIFEHERTKYLVKRSCLITKETNDISDSKLGKSDFKMLIWENGKYIPHNPHQTPEDIIGRILPESLHRYFFFDGERIEQIVRPNKKSEIAEATKKLLGVELFNRAIKHLGEARKTLEKELEKIGDPETQELVKRKNKLNEELDKLEDREKEIEQESKDQKILEKEVVQRLKELEGVTELEEKREDLGKQKQTIKNKIKQCISNLSQAIYTDGYKVFLLGAIHQFKTLVDGLRERGELPSDIKFQFVQDLIKRKRCICGMELNEGTSHYKQVEAYLDRGGLADVEEKVIRMGAQIEEIEQKIPEFWLKIDSEQSNLEQLTTNLSQIETQIDNIDDKLRNSPSEDVRGLQTRRDNIAIKINTLILEQGAIQQKRSDINAKIQNFTKQIDNHQMKEEQQALVQRQLAVAEEAVIRLKEVRENLDRMFRFQLELEIQKIFKQISFTPYIPKLSDNYELTLVEQIRGEETSVPASTGENQILSLSFVGGIIERVRQWSKDKKSSFTFVGPDSSAFPIIMDSPFGSLDETYRRQVANSIPKLANQLVVLLTKTQWRGEVEDEMRDSIGREYVLIYNSSKPDNENDEIVIEGVKYPLVRLSPNEFEYTEIQEVKLLNG